MQKVLRKELDTDLVCGSLPFSIESSRLIMFFFLINILCTVKRCHKCIHHPYSITLNYLLLVLAFIPGKIQLNLYENSLEMQNNRSWLDDEFV